MFEIAIGAVSGVVASFILYLLRIFTNKHFIPLFQKLSYKGSNIEGRWLATSTEQDTRDENEEVKVLVTLTILQNAYDINGRLEIKMERYDGTETINYVIYGQYSEGYLQLLCTAKSKGLSTYATILLKAISNGSGLEGVMSFRHSFEDKVDQMTIRLIMEK